MAQRNNMTRRTPPSSGISIVNARVDGGTSTDAATPIAGVDSIQSKEAMVASIQRGSPPCKPSTPQYYTPTASPKRNQVQNQTTGSGTSSEVPSQHENANSTRAAGVLDTIQWKGLTILNNKIVGIMKSEDKVRSTCPSTIADIKYLLK